MSKTLLQPDDHLSDDDILRFIDGELAPRPAAQVRNHLEACWSCRARRDRLQTAIDQFVGYRDEVFGVTTQPPPGNWLSFASRLQAQAARMVPPESPSAAILRRFRRILAPVGTQPWLVPAATTLTLLLVIAGLLLLRAPGPAVSGMALLEQSAHAERAVFTGGDRVVHRSITLEERVPGSAAVVATHQIEIWQTGARQLARRLYGQQGKLVAGAWTKSDGSHLVYGHGKLAPAAAVPPPPLADDQIWQIAPSAEDFARVTGNSGRVTVTEQPAAYELSYRQGATTGEPRLLYAKLTLRRHDLHAIAQDLRVQQHGQTRDYRFVETAYRAHPAAEVALSVFRVDAMLTADVRIQAAGGERPEPLTLPATADLEVEVLDRLDRAGALLQDEVKVERADRGPVTVKGVVAGDERRQELIAALGPVANDPALQLTIRTVAEIENERDGVSSRPMQLQPLEVPADVQRPNTDLERYLRESRGLAGEALQAEIKRITYLAVDHLSEARMQAAFLRRLLDAFPAGELDTMSPPARERWRTLAKRHARQMEIEIHGLHDSLAPAFRPATVRNMRLLPMQSDRELRSSPAQILAILTLADRVVWKALAASSDAAASAHLRGPVFWQSLETAEQLAANLKNGLER